MVLINVNIVVCQIMNVDLFSLVITLNKFSLYLIVFLQDYVSFLAYFLLLILSHLIDKSEIPKHDLFLAKIIFSFYIFKIFRFLILF